MSVSKQRRKRGGVHLEVTESGSQRLRWTFKGKRQTELFTTADRMREIEYLIATGTDPKQKSLGTSLGILDVSEILSQWVDWKAQTCREETVDGYMSLINRVTEKLPYDTIENPNAIKRWVITNCTTSTAKRFLMYLNAACLEINGTSNFQGMAKQIRERWEEDPDPRILTEDEIREGFKKMNPCYSDFFRFMLLTGCRPSEALGLQLSDISDNQINFQRQRQLTRKGEKVIEKLKTQKKRLFPMYDQLILQIDRLLARRSGLGDEPEWLFVDRKGKPLNYSTLRRNWDKFFPEDTTMYNCRDTFITNQLLKGISSDVVAVWCGNSARVIKKHYQDNSAFVSVIPR